MDLQESFNTIRTKYSIQLEGFKKAILEGMVALIYPEYLRKILQNSTEKGTQIIVPSLQIVHDFLDIDKSLFMQMVSANLIRDLMNNDSIKLCIEYPELEIFNHDKVDPNIIKVLFDINISNSIADLVVAIINEKFKLNTEQSVILQDDKLSLFTNSEKDNYKSEYEYLFLQILFNLIVKSKSFLIDKNTEIIQSNTNADILLSNNFLVAINSINMPGFVYFTKDILNNPIYDKVSLATNTIIQKISIEENDEGYLLNSGALNQIWIFNNKDHIF